jgi:hypothetical protein
VCIKIGYAENNKAWKVLLVRGDKLKIVDLANIRFNRWTASRIRAVLPAEKLPIEPESAHDDGETGVHDIVELGDIHDVD